MDTSSVDIRTYKKLIEANIKKAQLKLGDLPMSREASLVRTKLDEALLWLREVSDQLPTSG